MFLSYWRFDATTSGKGQEIGSGKTEGEELDCKIPFPVIAMVFAPSSTDFSRMA